MAAGCRGRDVVDEMDGLGGHWQAQGSTIFVPLAELLNLM